MVLSTFAVPLVLAAAIALPLNTSQRPAPAASSASDPFTRGDEAALAAAGYASFGPFAFGTNHTSADVVELLPDEPLLWIETAHFRIGSALPPIAVAGDKAWQLRLQGELERLGKRLPNVPLAPRQLDSWLRAHLIAQRVEEVYSEVLANLPADGADFPAAPGHEPGDPSRFLGLGPFLGLPQKYTILLVQKSASLAKYTAAHHSWATTNPTRFHDHRFGCAFFGAALESSNGLLQNDEALRTHLTFHTAHNLYTSYRSYSHNLPTWLVTGLAHWHARIVSQRFPIYDLRTGPGGDPKLYLQWERRWPVMLKARTFEPLASFVERMDVNGFSMDDHLQCWAFVDWLLLTRREATIQFLHRMKDPFHERLRFPTEDELFARQRIVMQQSFGTDAAGLEQQWRKSPGTRVAQR